MLVAEDESTYVYPQKSFGDIEKIREMIRDEGSSGSVAVRGECQGGSDENNLNDMIGLLKQVLEKCSVANISPDDLSVT